MGYDYYAASIVGCRVPASKIASVFKTACGCGVRNPQPKFCPTCGKPYSLIEVVEIEGYDGEKFRGLDVIGGLDGEHGDFVIGLLSNIDSGSRPRCYRPEDVQSCTEKVRSVLEPCGLWDADQFGVWCVLSGC